MKVGQFIQFQDNGQICKVVSIDSQGNPKLKDINTGKVIEHAGRLYKIITFVKAVIKLFIRLFG
jgi:translation elongation factor P/translation initiation factor 5A